MTSRPLVPASWSALPVPTIVAGTPKHVGTEAGAGLAWSVTPRRMRANPERAKAFTAP